MFERIKLPYGYGDLEPSIDAATVETHYEKHHKTYTDKFNELLQKAPDLAGKSAEDILMHLDRAPQDIRTGLRNNGGGYYNHNLYFESMTPGGTPPSGKLDQMITDTFGGLDPLLEELHKAATVQLFGSGWAWLVLENGRLAITISSNQDSPLQQGNPNLLLPVDMWEHVYYLKYKNLKSDYVKAYFKVVNWDVVAKRLDNAR